MGYPKMGLVEEGQTDFPCILQDFAQPSLLAPKTATGRPEYAIWSSEPASGEPEPASWGLSQPLKG